MLGDFADNILKGITNSDLIEGNSVNWTAFTPPSNSLVNGWKESSINWEDDSGAINNLLQQKNKNGDPKFKAGIVRISRNEIDKIIEHFKIFEKFSYNRDRLDNNKYHGNLLFAENMKSELKATICGSLSRYAKFVENYDN